MRSSQTLRTVVLLVFLALWIPVVTANAASYKDCSTFLNKLFADNGMTEKWTSFKKHFFEGFKRERVAGNNDFLQKLAADPTAAIDVVGGFCDDITEGADKMSFDDLLNCIGKLYGFTESQKPPTFELTDDAMKLLDSIYKLVELAASDAVTAVDSSLFKGDRFTTYNKLGTTISRLMENVYLNFEASEKLAKDLAKTKTQVWIDVASCLRMAGDIDRRLLWEGMKTLAFLTRPNVLNHIEKVFGSYDWGKPDKNDFASGSVMYNKKYSIGRVIVGGRGKTVYKKPVALIIDLGGSDEYQYAPCSLDNVPASVVLDFHGNDKYVSKKFEGRTAGGVLGISLLVDREGMDTYITPRIGIGAALYGISVVIDEKGTDKYIGGEFCCGAAMYGIGILWDKEGNDSYTTGMLSCGFGGPMGIGLLIDNSGNDKYKSFGKLKPLDGSKEAQTYSQGFGFGFHPLTKDGGEGTISAFGGCGFLIDCAGNDHYDAGYAAQGGAFYYGVGTLYDASGDDRYKGGSHCQGSALYNSIGILIDKAGKDYYATSGLYGQGCAFDAAFGLLWDEGGNDSYNGKDYSQACSSHNGMALLFDLGGADSYRSRDLSAASVGAEGEHWEEDWPSIAVLADFGTERNAFPESRKGGTNSIMDFAVFLVLPDKIGEALKKSLKIE